MAKEGSGYSFLPLTSLCSSLSMSDRTCSACGNPGEFYSRNTICKVCARDRAKVRSRLRYEVSSSEERTLRNTRSMMHSRRQRRNPSERGRCIWKDTRGSDRKAGRSNDLTVEFIDSVIRNGCSYCLATDSKMTLDRVDNTLGHLTSNVVPACIRCNYMRRDMPHAAWLVLLPAIRQAREAGLFGSWTGDCVRRNLEGASARGRACFENSAGL
jgi:hypothetical protein